MDKGIVYLIGAGPGDVDLITVKGLKIIQKADVIVYDRLANPKLLQYRKPDSELIYVGKKSNQHIMKQEDINQLLVDLANEGKTVARLKGGDPYVFGRGGEEGELLFKNNILFEVIPGITSAIAAPNYAGIPVTHRNVAVNFTVITGHEDPLKSDSQLNWKRLAEDEGTLIFLMGVGNLVQITENLIANGKKESAPVAVIQWGTRPEQRTVVGTLNTIVSIVLENKITSPAIILVGNVVNMREKLSWFEKKRLFGKKIIVTRSREQASELSEKIETLGGESLEYPTIAINHNFDKTALKNAINNIEDYQWLIFASVNAFKSFKEVLLEERKDIRALNGIKICAIGSETQKIIENSGLIVDVVPEKFVAESIVESLKPFLNIGEKVLIPRSNLGRKILVETIKDLGGIVSEVIAYETVLETNNDMDYLLTELSNKTISMITFTSSSTVKNFITLLGNDYKELLKNIPIASIGPVTSETIKDFDLNVTLEAETHTISGLVSSIKSYYNS